MHSTFQGINDRQGDGVKLTYQQIKSNGQQLEDQSNENIPSHITFMSKFIDVSVDSVTGSFF